MMIIRRKKRIFAHETYKTESYGKEKRWKTTVEEGSG